MALIGESNIVLSPSANSLEDLSMNLAIDQMWLQFHEGGNGIDLQIL